MDLQPQFQWAGASLINLRLLVCRRCLDTPQPQLRSIIVPADPPTIVNARVEQFAADEAITAYGSQYAIGAPAGLNPLAQMPLVADQKWAITVPFLSISATGTTLVTVTCSTSHGLATDAQIGVEGLTFGAANGIFSITVTSGTAFTYDAPVTVPSGSLLSSSVTMVTTNVGLPYGFTTIPRVG